jgi:predicted NAD-dependent protein-ADP-ribosyltransferase YbiA (DUF1768 family)
MQLSTGYYTQLNEIPDWRKILSNFHVSKFTYKDHSYNTIEHCYHAQRFSLVSEKIAFKLTLDSGHVFGQGSGLDARKRRKIIILTKEQLEKWEKIKHNIIKDICLAKYNQVAIYKKVKDLTDKFELAYLDYIQNY